MIHRVSGGKPVGVREPERIVVEPDNERYPPTNVVRAARAIAEVSIRPFWEAHPAGKVSFYIGPDTMTRDEGIALILSFESPEDMEEPPVHWLGIGYRNRMPVDDSTFDWEVAVVLHPGGLGERRAYRVELGAEGIVVREGPIVARFAGVPPGSAPKVEHEVPVGDGG